jgi:hypothetical protein
MILLLSFHWANISSAQSVQCENIRTRYWDNPSREYQTCCLSEQTSIDSDDVLILSANDREIQALEFRNNRKISYLPKNVHRGYGNLIIYDASLCSIKSLCYENFEQLVKLQFLHLEENLIEAIDWEIFMDLEALIQLDLSMKLFVFKQLKFLMSPKIFLLPKATTASLS